MRMWRSAIWRRTSIRITTPLRIFRKQHLAKLGELFVQALQLCQKAGLVKLGHVAIDGTKMQANASKHKAMSYGRMGEAEQKLQAEVEALLRHARKWTRPKIGNTGRASEAMNCQQNWRDGRVG